MPRKANAEERKSLLQDESTGEPSASQETGRRARVEQPGPLHGPQLPLVRGLPLLGCLRLLFSSFTGRYRYFTELSARTERYGDFFACSLPGGRKWFVVSSARALRETVGGPQEDAFNGRPEAKTSGVSMFLHHAKSQADGVVWKDSRKVSMSIVSLMQRDAENIVGTHINEFLTDMEELIHSLPVGQEVTKRDVGLRVGRLASSCLLEVLFGKQYRELIDVEQLDYIIETNYMRTKHVINYDFLMQKASVNWWRRLIPERWQAIEWQPRRNISSQIDRVKLIYRNALEKMVEKMKTEGRLEGVEPKFLELLPTNVDKNGKNLEPLITLVDDLMVPMTNSPRHVACWSLLLLADKSDVQQSVQKELDTAFGSPGGSLDSIRFIKEKCASASLAYSMATFWEVMRFGSVIVTNFTRRVTESSDGAPVRVRGCEVPKDSYLTINFWAINRDRNQWKDKTYEFWPENFYEVDTNGVPCVKKEAEDQLVAFSLGGRRCPMRTFVQSLLQALFCVMFHRFDAQRGSLMRWPSILDAEVTANRETLPYSVCLKKRGDNGSAR